MGGAAEESSHGTSLSLKDAKRGVSVPLAPAGHETPICPVQRPGVDVDRCKPSTLFVEIVKATGSTQFRGVKIL